MSGDHAGLPHTLPSGGETVTMAPRSGSRPARRWDGKLILTHVTGDACVSRGRGAPAASSAR